MTAVGLCAQAGAVGGWPSYGWTAASELQTALKAAERAPSLPDRPPLLERGTLRAPRLAVQPAALCLAAKWRACRRAPPLLSQLLPEANERMMLLLLSSALDSVWGA